MAQSIRNSIWFDDTGTRFYVFCTAASTSKEMLGTMFVVYRGMDEHAMRDGCFYAYMCMPYEEFIQRYTREPELEPVRGQFD